MDQYARVVTEVLVKFVFSIFIRIFKVSRMMYSLHIPPCLTYQYLFPRTSDQSLVITDMLPSTFIVLLDCDVTFELSISCKFSNVLFNLENVKDSSTN
jgi:hypothetical protein